MITHEEDTSVSVTGNILGKIERLNGQKEFWRIVALGLVIITTLSLLANFWLAFSLNSLNNSISYTDCRTSVYSDWSEKIKKVVDASVLGDKLRLVEANRELQELDNLKVLYLRCAQTFGKGESMP